MLCKRCNTDSVRLATANYITFSASDDDGEYDGEDVQTDVSLYAHICFNCNHLVDVGIESPREKIAVEETSDAKNS